MFRKKVIIIQNMYIKVTKNMEIEIGKTKRIFEQAKAIKLKKNVKIVFYKKL